ncbi:MAG: hypothetical protein ABI999_08675 [Acidobacteriota bacterium]
MSLTYKISFAATFFLLAFICGCTAEAKLADKSAVNSRNSSVDPSDPASSTKGATIKIEPGSPADTVRAFYQKLRDKKFREALFLTNLRPAIEGLTDSELKEFDVDFEAMSQGVPQVIQINGEITTGDQATVTAKLPGDDPDKLELQQIKLRRENGVWIILTVDETAETVIKAEGKNYFYKLRIDTHHEEAKAMLDRISKAEMVYATQNQNLFGEMSSLVEMALLPPDVLSSASTGYNYELKLSSDKKKYSAYATPAEYGKSGKLSFWVELDEKGTPHLDSKENGGKKVKN